MTVVAEGEDLESHAKVIPLVHRKTAMGGKTTAYVCEKGVCGLPTSDPKVFSQQIKKVKKLARADKS